MTVMVPPEYGTAATEGNPITIERDGLTVVEIESGTIDTSKAGDGVSISPLHDDDVPASPESKHLAEAAARALRRWTSEN